MSLIPPQYFVYMITDGKGSSNWLWSIWVQLHFRSFFFNRSIQYSSCSSLFLFCCFCIVFKHYVALHYTHQYALCIVAIVDCTHVRHIHYKITSNGNMAGSKLLCVRVATLLRSKDASILRMMS